MVAAGSLGTNSGTVTCTAASSTKVQATILPKQGVSHSSFYTIPAGKTGYITFAEANTWADSTAKVNVEFVGRDITNNGYRVIARQTLSSNNVFAVEFPTSLAIPEKFDFYLKATTTRANTVVNVRYALLIETN
jgi:hypothetical protein